MWIFNWEGKLKRRGSLRIGHSSSRSGTTNEEAVNNDLQGSTQLLDFSKIATEDASVVNLSTVITKGSPQSQVASSPVRTEEA
jgi:hypothetical protein